MESPFFTIIVPVIRATYLAATLKSVQEQDFSNWELIIINDASKDEIDEIVNEFRDDQRVQYIKNAINQGATSHPRVWNQGLALAQGRFTLILGDDDLYGSGFLSQLNQIANKYPDAALLRARLCVMNAEGNILYYSPRLPEWAPWWDVLYSRVGYSRHPLSISEHCFRTMELRSSGGFWELHKCWGTDDAAVLKASLSGGCASTNKAYAYWRNDGKNISSQPVSPEMSLALKEVCNWQEKFILENANSIQNFSSEEILRVVKEREKEVCNYYLQLTQEKTLKNKLKNLLKL